jgi:hypothetical protein
MRKSIAERIKKGLKKFRPILETAKARDINESDTVQIITDMLCEIFGWDKYTDITTEYAIRGTYCDLALKHDGELKYLIEAKAINIDLKEIHLRQAINYAANNGNEWTILTNGVVWQIYKIKFEKPIQGEHIFSFDLLESSQPKELIDRIYTLAKEAVKKDVIEDFAARQELVNKDIIAALLLSKPLLELLRREIRRMDKNVKVSLEEIEDTLKNEVLKRELMISERAAEAKKRIKRAATAKMREVSKKKIKNEQEIKTENIDETSEKIVDPTSDEI